MYMSRATPTAMSHRDEATYAIGVQRLLPACQPVLLGRRRRTRASRASSTAADDDSGEPDPAWRSWWPAVRATPIEGGPGAGEEVAEVLADGDPEVAVEGLEDDVIGLVARPRSRRDRHRGAREIGDEERPADQAEELDRGRQHAGRTPTR